MSSINLSEYVDYPFTNKATFNYDKFKNDVKIAVTYMNDILDEAIKYNLYPLKQQRQMVIDWRQIGIGVMGIADMLIKLNIRYGSKESLEICDKIGFEMINSALQQSALLAKEKGVYPKYKAEAILNSQFLKYNAYPETLELIRQYGLRNSQLLTIAPTGSISTMWGISGGIEPIYDYYYIRKTESLHEEETEYKVFTPIVKEYMDMNNLKDDNELPNFFISAKDLNFYDRIDMQAIWQTHIDASISSTINLPFAISTRQVEDLYMYAWEKGLKGVTIYRDGCKRSGILNSENKINYEKVNNICPDCGSNNMIKVNGCILCQDCGYSPCSV